MLALKTHPSITGWERHAFGKVVLSDWFLSCLTSRLLSRPHNVPMPKKKVPLFSTSLIYSLGMLMACGKFFCYSFYSKECQFDISYKSVMIYMELGMWKSRNKNKNLGNWRKVKFNIYFPFQMEMQRAKGIEVKLSLLLQWMKCTLMLQCYNIVILIQNS